MLPLDPAFHEGYRRKIREARARQGAPVPKGTKFTDEHKENLKVSFATSSAHKSKNQNGVYNPNYKGGFLDKHGYRVVRANGKEAMEHRCVMKKMIGRPLLAHETVHHKNGKRDDNRPSNLELWSSRQPKGQRIEDKVVWAREIMALYGELIFGGVLNSKPYSHEEDEFLS